MPTIVSRSGVGRKGISKKNSVCLRGVSPVLLFSATPISHILHVDKGEKKGEGGGRGRGGGWDKNKEKRVSFRVEGKGGRRK